MRTHDSDASIDPCPGQDAPGPWLIWVDERRSYRVVAHDGPDHQYQYALERRAGYDAVAQERWVPVDLRDARDIEGVPRQLIEMVTGHGRSPESTT
jgi:hypothetical protein